MGLPLDKDYERIGRGGRWDMVNMARCPIIGAGEQAKPFIGKALSRECGLVA
jgi:hypothetical protein